MAHQDGSRTFRIPALDVAALIRSWQPAQRVAPRDTAPAPDEWRATMRRRVIAFAVAFAAWTVGIEARLLYLQVLQHDELSARANKQQLRTRELSPKRGEIYDRNGRLLAFSVDADTITADPTEVANPAEVARQVCAALETCDDSLRSQMEDRLRMTRRQFVYLARKVGPGTGRRVAGLELEGVYLYPESRRYYPNRELAAHLLGYVGLDNIGLAGLESAYDRRIRGREGQILLQVDARHEVAAVREQRLPTAGDSLELTIDRDLQHIAERELRAGVERERAAGGVAVIMQPRTGEILALANWPTFNPNAFGSTGTDARRNRAVQNLYEPGSTFKIVTASAALEEQVIRPGDPIDCAPGFITFGSRRINDVHPYGVLPFTDVIVKSSNVGAIKVGQRLGPERLHRYVTRFGFGQRIAPDFSGENPGIVTPPGDLTPSALASVSMGYQIAVTPLQMAAAVSAVANGGTLFEPRIVRAFIRDGRREEVRPRALRRVIAPETAATLTAIMEEVVERGTAESARIPGYTIAGKTGTASKLVDGRYSRTEYFGSFVGFVPSRDPELAIIVVIDSPHARGYYGGVVAAPVFKRIAEAAVRHLGIPPTLNALPPVLVARHGAATPVVSRVSQGPGSAAAEAMRAGLMPDLRGVSARQAIRILKDLGITPTIQGDGFVIDQAPLAGAPLEDAGACSLRLGRHAPAPAERGAPQ